ncbi:MAG: hypothetical protein WAM60_17235 [Candidatus Promineifilaceae bacterium]
MQLTRRSKSIILIGLLLILLTACNQDEPEEATPTAETAATPVVNESNIQYLPLVDDALGLSLQYPDGWVTQSSLGGATIATSQDVIDAESLADIGEEAFVVVIPGEIDYFNFQTAQQFSEDDVLQALATYKALLEKEGSEFVAVEPPVAFASENQKMARMIVRSVEDGEPLITEMAVVMGNGYMALISAASLEGTAPAMRPIFDHIIESVEVRPPGGVTTDNQ